MKTKSDGLSSQLWVIELLEQAKSNGYLLDTEAIGKYILWFYDSDYSAEDTWYEMFEENTPDGLF